MRLCCAVLDDFQGAALDSADWSPVRDRVEVVVFRDHLADEDALAAHLAGFDIVPTLRERVPLPATLLDPARAARRLRHARLGHRPRRRRT
jgi:hypothetical protein